MTRSEPAHPTRRTAGRGHTPSVRPNPPVLTPAGSTARAIRRRPARTRPRRPALARWATPTTPTTGDTGRTRAGSSRRRAPHRPARRRRQAGRDRGRPRARPARAEHRHPADRRRRFAGPWYHPWAAGDPPVPPARSRRGRADRNRRATRPGGQRRPVQPARRPAGQGRSRGTSPERDSRLRCPPPTAADRRASRGRQLGRTRRTAATPARAVGSHPPVPAGAAGPRCRRPAHTQAPEPTGAPAPAPRVAPRGWGARIRGFPAGDPPRRVAAARRRRPPTRQA